MAAEREIEAVRGEIEQLNARLATQKLRPADVERLQSERMSLERTVRALADERAQVEAAAADKAASIGQTREAVDAALAAYHADARRLALIPSNAANARGRCFTISFASDESDVNDTGVPRVLSVDIKGSIVPALEATLEELREAVLGDQSQLLELSAKKERVAEERADNEADLERLRHRLKKMENAYVVEKQRADVRCVRACPLDETHSPRPRQRADRTAHDRERDRADPERDRARQRRDRQRTGARHRGRH